MKSTTSNHEKPDTKLIFHPGLSNKAAVIIAKDGDVFLFVIYALGKLECSLLPWYMKIDSHQFIKIKKIYDYLKSEISDAVPELHAVTTCKFNVKKVHVCKIICKIFVQTIFYNRKLTL